MAATDARPVPRKNVAFRLYLAFRKNDGTLITSWTGADTELSLDGAAYADATNEATEIGTSGTGYIDLTSSELNADSLLVKSTVTNTDALPFVIALYPEESGDYRADMTLISGDATAADNAESFFDGTGYAGTNNVIPTVTTTATATNVTTVNGLAAGVITAASIATGAIDADALATDAVTEIQSGLATAAALATAQADLDTITGSDGVTLATAQALYAPAKAGNQMDLVNAPNATAITAIQSGLATATDLATVAGYLDTEIAAILADTNELQSDWTNGGRLDLILDSRASQTSVDDVPTTAEFNARTLAAADYATATALGTVDTVVDAIKVSTDRFETMIVLDGAVYQFTANALELAPTGGSAPSAADIYTYFTDSNREDAFKADVSLLALEATAQAILTDTAEIGAAGVGLTALAQSSIWTSTVAGRIDAAISTRSTFDHMANEVTPTAASKTGYALASNGLDSISTTEPTGVATNFREMVIASWMVNYAKNIKDGDAGTIIVYASNGSTVVTTQTYSVVGNVETVNRAT